MIHQERKTIYYLIIIIFILLRAPFFQWTHRIITITGGKDDVSRCWIHTNTRLVSRNELIDVNDWGIHPSGMVHDHGIYAKRMWFSSVGISTENTISHWHDLSKLLHWRLLWLLSLLSQVKAPSSTSNTWIISEMMYINIYASSS